MEEELSIETMQEWYDMINDGILESEHAFVVLLDDLVEDGLTDKQIGQFVRYVIMKDSHSI